MLRRASLAGLLSLFWGAPVARLPAQEIVISEIQYHPHGNDHGDEFLELENRGDSAVDLADWFLADGVFFRFAAGTVLAPGEAIVVSPDRERTVERYGLDPARVVGNWVGRLENSGEVLHLIDADGNSAFRVRYRDRGGWPQRPDGDGASLELLPGFWDPHLPGAWRASPRILGSPGEPTTSLDAAVDGGRDVSPRGAVWSYFEGTEEPSPDDPLGWTRTEFDDASWRTGEEPFGFGEAGLGTELTSMWGRNVTLYARQVFQLPRAELDLLESGMAEIAIRVTFDDGFALYLNGQERLRENLAGNRGEPIPFDQGAERAESSSRTLVLSGAGSGLQAGPNVIALQGVNRRAFSGDFLLGATVRLDREFTEEAALLINEVKPAGATAGFVEILNPDSRPRALSGYRLTDNPYGSDAYVFPGGSEVAAGGFLVVAADALPFALSVEERRILLVRPGGGFEDVFRGNPGNSERSAARVPDGAGRRFSTPTPTPGEPNRFFPDERVVVNEIHYHPAGRLGSALEFVELHNPGDTRVSLEGWRLSDAVDFPFPPETILEPGGYLVVAADPPTFEERYGVTALGPYEGRLANDEERLDLRDSWGNVLDRVHYADDGTWPEQADARGASLELAHPDLDNRFGAAWRASRPGGSPGQRNESFSVDVTPRVAAVRHDPPMPSTRDAVRVTCRVLDNGPLRQVVLSWSRDGGGGGGDVGMNDSGMDGDDTAGDGLYTAVIPAQPDGSTVRFTITASDAISGETAPGNGRFYLYEVNSTPAVRSDIPHYTILMTRDNWRRLRSRGNGSDRLLDGTFVDHQRGDVYYNVGVRYRGNGTRNPPDGRFNYRVQFGDDRKFQGLKRLNFNSQNPHRQFMGNNTFRRLGIPYPLTVPVALRFEAAVDVGYVRLEAYDEDFLGRFFGRDDGGNLYRALRGRLEFLGFDPNDYNGRYRKQTNEEDGDFSDLIDLLRSFEIRDDDAFSREIQQRIDVREWILYFAAQGALGNNENSINLDAGDDYFLYSRPSDGRFFILPWDSDSVFVDATQALFRPSSAAVRRLLAHPHFAPLYYCALDAIQETYLSEEAIGKRLARVADIYSENQVASIRDFVALRNSFLDANVPRELSVSTDREQRDFLVARGDEWAYWRGVTHPSRGDLSWTELDFEDRGWPVGPSGFGYGDGDDATLIDDMRDRYPTVFVRRKFRIEDAAAVETLTLWVDYDDGFVAYLNGREIARRNFSGDIPSHTDTATRDREAGTEERFRLDDFLDEVRDGENVLALVVFNGTLDSSDLSLIPSLEVELRDHVVACGDVLMTPESQITLNGSAPGCGTASVLVGGSAANYVPRQGSWEAVVDLRPGPNHLEILALDAVGRPVMSETLVVERTTGLTPLPGRIPDDLRLSAAEGPYLLDGEVVVERGAELVVEGGAELLVSQGSRLVVLGRLHVAGSAAEPVVFRPSRCGLTWRGILLEGDGGGRPHRLEGCELRSGAPGADGFVQIDGGRLEVRDARFTEIDGTAVGAFESEVTAERVEIVGSRRGFVLKGGRLTLEDSRLAGITDEGIDADAGGVVVRGCRISAGGAAVLLRGGSHEIRETLLWASGTGISVDAGTSLSGDHNTLAGNALGVRSAAGAGAVFLSSHVVWGNGLGVAGEASFEFSDVQGAVPPGPGNISANPLFTAPERGNFELSPGSPAIGAGRDGTDMGAFPSGGGAVRFVRGDSDSNGAVNLSDAVRTLLYLFQGAGPVRCPDAADANDDGGINLTDPIFLLNYLFLGGSPPPPPFPQEGVDPSGDGLDCSP